MDREKIKVRLSNISYMELENDMQLFNFYKPNGTLNKNKFYNKVIKGMFSNFKITTNLITDVLIKENKKNDNNQLYSLALRINEEISSHRFSDKSFYHQNDIYIQITNETREMYKEIELNYLVNNTLSEFIRNLFNEYLCMPQFEREQCLFWNEYKTLIEAKDLNREIIISTIHEKNIRIRLLILSSAEAKSFIYAVGYMVTENGNFPISIKLSEITSIVMTNKYYEISDDEQEYLLKLLGTGIEHIGRTIENIIVKFDEEGFNYFAKDVFGPAAEYNEENELCTFICDEDKMFEYLKQYGKHAKVISPITLKDKLKKFYIEAINEDD